jgi:hypothetical protein
MRGPAGPRSRRVLTGLLLICLFSCDKGEVGGGPLLPPANEAPVQSYSGFRLKLDHAITFGLVFVKNHGSEDVVLDGVELVGKTPGLELVGVLVADITGDRHTWSSDDNFPPARPRDQHAARGFTLRPDAMQAAQLLLGIKLTRPGQEGFRAVAVLYHVGDQRYRYTYPSGAAACSRSFYVANPSSSCDATRLFPSSAFGDGS